MHNQNANTVRQGIRDRSAVDVEAVSETLIATTDPTASRQLRELDRALPRLPLEQRQVILLVGLEGMSYEATAGILGVPVGTIRSRLSRAETLFANSWAWMPRAVIEPPGRGPRSRGRLCDLFHQSATPAGRLLSGEKGGCHACGFAFVFGHSHSHHHAALSL